MKRLKYWTSVECTYDTHSNALTVPPPEIDQWDRKEIRKEFDKMNDEDFYYHPATRNSHYTALNCLPVAVGTRWSVSESIYWEFLEMLPPLALPKGFRADEGFRLSESSIGSIYSVYYKRDGSYWHEYIDALNGVSQ